jgi:hypothetical protein
MIVIPGKLYRKGRISTVYLLVKMARFVKQEKIFLTLKGIYLNLLGQGGQLY